MSNTDAIDDLKRLSREPARRGQGRRLRRALLMLAIPATALLTTACYAVPMVEDQFSGEAPAPEGVDCDGDGQLDAPSDDECLRPKVDLK